MKGKELFAVIDGIKKPLRQWAEEYDLPYKLVYERYLSGWKAENLILPERCDMLSPSFVHKRWGGTWYYGKHPVTHWNKKQKWVDVGNSAACQHSQEVAVMLDRLFMTADEIVEIMGVAKPTAYQLIRELNKELKEKGYITIQGKVSTQYFYERCGLINVTKD